ncbi:hypothetical protein Ptr902_00730 [Pyrenophora tritici-repentis]|uniref:Uncharacterized protein n=3 Tax=Pyrenophora tritici-repentis TaxID=45151 RepID=A0A2W1D3Z1_9PLEO|nr:uncharacterized protein PTRG_01789 [Pyrenophora tritici-repentis Pt-1C-BFP]KAI1518216.1 hypothetical protein Ptr86124_003517 [Pyrenophora tritici-repentis]EDU41227.1 predicted protein [Pyrenophora tritici-repentis Pt-1C-BFP]KAI1527198.1 hypothetical protein PtrSN001A_009563 [Pyrenophora tritici-repentis]KAI1562900.1 hypothetical protein PtrEW4_009708 [Pyrenophora tritici-repentis]KAI1574269.1 hypothetical protein PtrEW7m1_006919 [Pyrenophora tritici-repentis]
MLITGIILAPAAMATPAVHDLADLQSVIDAAASSIGDPNNPNRGFGFNLLGGSGQMGTADLVNNITNSILRGKFQFDTNKTTWLDLPSPSVNKTTNPIQLNPTLPITASLAQPTILPTTIPTLENLTINLTEPYMAYVKSIPDLSTSLITLGRSFHREMNAPVSDAIAGLEQSLTTFQTTLLEDNLISAQAVIRTIRASGSLANAQIAWSRFLNLPGGGSSDADAAEPTAPLGAGGLTGKRAVGWRRPPPKDGQFYTHQELWNRSVVQTEQSTQGSTGVSGVVVQVEEQDTYTQQSAKNARVGRPFVV